MERNFLSVWIFVQHMRGEDLLTILFRSYIFVYNLRGYSVLCQIALD